MNSPEFRTKSVRRVELVGYALTLSLFGIFGIWAFTVKIAGAVIAPATIAVESHVKKVQHPTGGVVAAIEAHDGQYVLAGKTLIRLDDTVARSTAKLLRDQIDNLKARLARLHAERDAANSITFPASLLDRPRDERVNSIISGELKLFESRRAANKARRLQLEQRIVQSKQEIEGLKSQVSAKAQEIDFLDKELVSVKELWGQNLVAISRLMQLERDRARVTGERGQYTADIARAEGKISETNLEIIQADKDFDTDVLKDLRDTEAKISESTERLIAADDQLKRVEILAPQDGIVSQLAVHAAGEVVSPGEQLAEIVPKNDELIVEGRVEPRDIDQIKVGGTAIVRISAGDPRTEPDLIGLVSFVSADPVREPASADSPGRSYYKINVKLSKVEIARLGRLPLVPGMQAEVFVQTRVQTPLRYLIKPLTDQMSRTFKAR